MTKRLATHLFALVMALSVVSGARAYAPKSHAEITDPSPKTALRAFSEFSPNSDRRIGSEVFERTRKNRPATTNFAKDLSLDPWGSIALTQGTSQNRKLFTGHQSDFATGLVYAKARYYDPSTGGFLTQDSWQGEPDNPHSMQKYAYGYHNPLRFTDPSGNNPVDQYLKEVGENIDRSLERSAESRKGYYGKNGVRDAIESTMFVSVGAIRRVIGMGEAVAADVENCTVGDVGDCAVAQAVSAIAQDPSVLATGLVAMGEKIGYDAYGGSQGDPRALANVGGHITDFVAPVPGEAVAAKVLSTVGGAGAKALSKAAPKLSREVASAARTFGKALDTPVSELARRAIPEAKQFGTRFAEGWSATAQAQRTRGFAGAVPGMMTAERAYGGLSSAFSRRGPSGSIVDNNILTRIAQNDAEALTFAGRNHGKLHVNREVMGEFVTRHGEDAFESLRHTHGIGVVDVAPGRTAALMEDLGITASKRFNDMSVVAAAEQYGLRIVTGDTGVVSAALRRGLNTPSQLAPRIFEHSPMARTRWYSKIRNLIQQHGGVDPMPFTGSPLRK